MIAAPAASPERFRGRLELVFSPGERGTVLAHAHAAAPLKIVRPFPLAGGGVLVQVLTLGPGLCAGDTHEIDITVEPGARAVVIMQSASRLLSMPEGTHASQEVTLTVRNGGQLALPGPDDSVRGQQFHPAHRRADRHGRAPRHPRKLVDGAEQPGRAPSLPPDFNANDGDDRSRSGVCRRHGARACAHNVQGTGILEAHRYVASGFWCGATLAAAPPLSTPDGTLMAIGQTAPGQVYLRALAMDGYALGETLQAAVNRIHCGWQQAAIPFRRFTS